MPSRKIKPNYTRAVVIVHGKSERCLVKFNCSNLHLSIKIEAKHKGNHSIQITSLNDYLKLSQFKNLSRFKNTYDINYDNKKKKLLDFKLFIIMDTDDCTEYQAKRFINKEMFKEHLLYDYIVPIYNTNNLEDVMIKCGIMTNRIENSKKGSYYTKVFPINSKPLCNDTKAEVITLQKKLLNSNNTNLNEFIDYCLSLLK